MNITSIPAPRVNFIDERTGLMSREWYRFFLNLYTLTGSGNNTTSLDEVQIAPYSDSEAIAYASTAAQDAQLMASRYEAILDDIQTQPAAIMQAAEDQLAPVVQVGTLGSQNSDNVNITGGKLQGLHRSSDTSAGISTTVTSATLTGKTITFKDGVCTGFA